ncbi:hypothetical protein M569_06544, partial [Genlisea aurea]
MAKRGYKLQEFVAHSGNVNCLSFGKKSGRVFITGGDDQKVNLWSFGRPSPLMSLCGHSSPVESASFDSAEALVVAGSSSGAIKLWDLEETKMVRTLTGHRSYCTAVEFHPFGEFFASGSMDTNLKIWDIRKKGCIHTHKGHTRGISTIRFTPDGRWVVSGGLDNAVKVWDLTAGKLLHDFKFHEGHVRSIEFHPLEFLLATGSADKTVKFWDLETFEMIGSTTREATGLRAMAFHPDGRTLFCGLDDSLKVYSWEPVICHDSVSMGWSTLGDLCFHDGKLLGGAYFENMVAIWMADILALEPNGKKTPLQQPVHLELERDRKQSFLDKEGNSGIFSSSLQSTLPDCDDSKGIKTIYVDRINSVTSNTVREVDVPEHRTPSVSKETSTPGTQKHGPTAKFLVKSNRPADNRPAVSYSASSSDSSNGKVSVDSRTESSSLANSSTSLSTKPFHTRRLSSGRFDVERISFSLESTHIDNAKVSMGMKKVSNISNRILTTHNDKESSNSKDSTSKIPVAESDGTRSAAIAASKMANALGRTRSLVERFERKEKTDVDDVDTSYGASAASVKPFQAPSSQKTEQKIVTNEEPADDNTIVESLMLNHDVLLSTFQSRLTKLQVVRHLWEKNDVKGAIEALRKLPDHAVQADVVGVLVQKMELITLDLFSCLLPMLEGLLSSPVERHGSTSLEMVMKLWAVFGSTVRSTVSAPQAVGVDIHGEERFEWCKQCACHLQSIQRMLPELVKREGNIGRYAQELSMLLQ